jgi:two-component system sensor histidine kinase/response regulator
LGELSQKQQNYLQIIHNSGEQLLETINDILELSQVEAGKTVLNLSEFSLSQMARQTLQMLREKADIRGVKLRAEINLSSAKRNPKEKGNRSYQQEKGFIADSRRIRQVLVNLLSNAVKFTPEGGRVTLRVWMENNHAVFQVEDTGIGIPEHQRSLLFQKFQQLDSSYNRQYEGTGLGLALTKQLVELHNGRIEVESTVGSGSTFTVWLPVQPVPTNINSIGLRSVNGNEPLPIKPAGQVVLIEDREEVAILICDILTSASYQVVWLSETANAIEQIKLLEPSLAIVDLRLIGVDDYEVTHYLRHSSATRQIKVLALIADEVPEDWESDLVATIDDYLPQPIHPEKLLQKVLALASGNQN